MRQQLNKRNMKSHGAQYKISIPKFDFKQAAIEEKMVDEVLQDEFNYQDGSQKKGNKKILQNKNNIENSNNNLQNNSNPALKPLLTVNKHQQQQMDWAEGEVSQEQWALERLEQLRQQHREQAAYEQEAKVYGYTEHDVLPPIGDDSFLHESLQSNKNLIKYDCFDEELKGHDWVEKYKDQKGPHGKSPLYINGKYQWVDIQVVGYDEDNDRYLIQTMAGQMLKEVNRLSILFRDENMDMFRSRLTVCKMRQQLAEDDSRFQKYVTSLDSQQVSSLSIKVKKLILQKALKRNKLENMNIIVQDLVTQLVQQVTTEYSCFMKKVVVVREMQDPSNDQKYQDKRLRIRRKQPAVPIIGIIKCRQNKQFNFREMREQVARLHISNKKQVIETMNMFTTKGYQFEHFSLFKTSLNRHQLPMDLVTFGKKQQSHFKTARQQLQYQWREDLISDINKKLDSQHFNFYEIDMQKYLKSDLARLLKRFDLMLNTYVRNFLLSNNIQDWCQFVQKFTIPAQDAEDIWLINDYPLLSINLEVNTKLQDKIKFMKKKKTKKLEEQNKLLQEQSLYENVPDEIIYFEPNYNKVLETLQQPLRNLITTVNGFNNMEKDLLSLLDIPERQTLVIDEQNIEIQQGMAQIKGYLDQGYQQAQQIMDQFKKYQFLFERSEKTLLKNIFGSAKEIVIEDLDRDVVAQSLLEIAQAKSAISKLCINQFNGRFFQVNTQKAKQDLIQKADEQIQIILNKLSEITFNNVELISKTYDDMIVQITMMPSNEHELMALKNFINENDLNLGRIDKKVVKVSQFLDIMDDYCFKFDEKNLQSFWFLKSMPAEIKSAVMEGTKKASSQDLKFREKLKREQDAFQEEMIQLTAEVEKIKKFNDYTKIKECAEKMMITKERIEKAQSTVANFNERERLFKMDVGEYDDLQVLVNVFEPFQKIWDLCQQIDYEKGGWMTQPFLKLNYADIEKKINNSYVDCSKLIKVFEELEQDNAVKISRELIEDIAEFKQKMWVIELLTTEAMVKKPAYWKEVFKECKFSFDAVNDEMSFIKLIKNGVLEHRGIIEELSKKADKQWGMEKKLMDIVEKLKELKLELFPYKSTFTLKGIDELQQTIDDYLNIIGMMKQSSFIKPVQKECNKCDSRLQLMQDTLDGWIKCQRNWMYLQPIFASEDIKKKMPLEKQKFDSVDKNWRATMDQFFKEGGLGFYDSMETDKLKNEFDLNNKNLDQIQKQLSQYMETKRRAFARFYFLSDDQLLEILADTKDPTKVQNHMNKCFEAIKYVEFKKGNVEVVAMISPEEEIVRFSRGVNVEEGDKKGNVEIWLLEIEAQMRNSIRDIVKQSVIQYQKVERTKWVLNWQAQIIIAVNMIKWTFQTEEAIMKARQDPQALQKHITFLDTQLQSIVNLVRGELKELDRMTLGALVTLDVHARDIINPLIEGNVITCQDFKWTSQLRYYYDEPTKGIYKDQVVIKVCIVNATQLYGFEYLGNSTRLVITPLTDRCYITLMGAYHLNYGGAPEGPAGTGKTETTKDLAKAVAMYCVVFNCSDGLNFQAMSKFFKGLVSSGSWCCFDEFNRINVEVLSVIAQQIIQIQNAIKGKMKSFTFDEEPDVKLISTCTVNITMNPGYAGRADLPDNLKALFRPCAMMVPNYAQISEIYLYSVGFQEATKLSVKIVASLNLSSELLSSQYHYDFGMRAIKAILVDAGNKKRLMPNENEDIVCLTALQAVNLPKFTLDDIPLFLSIMSDLFPAVEMPTTEYGALIPALEQACHDSLLQPTPNFINKCLQLYDTTSVRHGLMLVGETYSGKSQVIQVLKKAMNLLSKQGKSAPARCYELNPKAISSYQLYGLFDPDTKSWSDGVLPIRMRECAADDKNPEKKWVIFDGPVDAIWIENMNTVLDDNKKLCLTSGEVIKLSNQMTMMFEVEDLVYASPATISRCGMVFLQAKQLGWQPLVQSFVLQNKYPQALQPQQSTFIDICMWFIDPAIAFAKAFCTFPMNISWNSTVETLLENVATFLEPYFDEHNKVTKDIEDLLINFVCFGLVWSVGCIIEEKGRPKFHRFLKEMIEGVDVVEQYKLILSYSSEAEPWVVKERNVKIKDASNVYELCYQSKNNNWVHWMQTVPSYVIPKETPYNQLLIPTSDSVRMNFFLHLNVSRMRHVLFTGPTGTGKTANVVKELNDFYFNPECTNLITAFSGQTSANQVQKTVESKTTRKRKGVLGPEERKKMLVVFIDDLNMPIKEPEGQAQPPIEVLRQWQDYGGWYDLEDKEFRRLEDIVFVGAMGPPSQGRNSITSRYSRHYNIIYVESFESESLSRIFENIMEWFFLNQNGNLAKTVTNQKEKLVKCTVSLYNRVKKTFLPTPSKQHYVYNMRDVSKVFQGISKSTFKSLRSEEELIRLWCHECMRVFQDRLVNKEDQELFEVEIKGLIKDTFGKEWKDLVKQEPLLWASFVPSIYPDNDKSKRPLTDVYCELNDLEKVKKTTYDRLEDYNNFNPGKKMNLVLFMNAIQHVIRIVRIITTTFGHALLVGVGGSGRKSLATLSCFVAQYDLVQVDAKLWQEELQRVLKIAGLEMKNTVFLFSDAQVWKESQLEDICNILNNGDVPNLFPVEEKNKIIEEMAQYCSGTINQKWGYFVNACKENLHMVLCMSPEGEAFRKRILTFPGLVNCTTIDWFLPWPEDALRSTAASAIGKISHIPEQDKEGVVDVCADMQNRIFQMSNRMISELKRYFFVTPTSYLELLSTIQKLIQERSDNINLVIAKYENGLEKLAETEKDVSAKQIYLNELTPQLQIQTVKNNEMLVVLTQKQKDADAKKAVCEKDEEETNLIRMDAQAMSDNCQADLDKVMPLLEEASKALENLSSDDINTIKSYKEPPANMNKVLEGICIALGHEKKVKWEPKERGSFEKIQNFWAYSKSYILNSKLKPTILEYTPEKILQMPKNDIERLKKLMEDPLLEPKALKQASTNGYNLCKWIRAVIETNNALLVVEPKKKELAIAQEKLRKAEELLAEKKAQLKEVIDILKELQDSYDKAKMEKDQLEAKVKKCEIELDRAQKLISGLGGEKENWQKNAVQLREETKNIVGDVVLSSGIIAYLGAFPIHYREEAIAKWKALLQNNQILVSEGYSLQNVMTDLITIGHWVNQDKLPNDNFSIDNSIILKNSRRWPLMIDPQLQANIWVRQTEKNNKLVIVRPNENQNQLQLKIDNAKQCEWPLLLENVGETIDQIFDQVLNNMDKKTGFRFYITTKLANPRYSPETCVQVTLLNFMATQQGLEDQLLGTLVRIEEHNKYTQREQSIKDFFENKKRQKATEDMILKLLYESSGNILENETLIDTLQQSQKDSIEIEKKLKLQEDDKVKYQNLRNQFKNAAVRGSHLYFVISNLADVEPVYQFSLESYMLLFEKGIARAEKDKNKEIRVNNIVEKFTLMLYEVVVRSLLEKDKVLFSFLMTTKLMMEERKMITSGEIMFFAVGGTALKSDQDKPEGDWTSERQWAVMCQVADTFDIFKNIPKHMLANPVQWRTLLENPNVHLEEEVEWPKDFAHLNRFQKLIIIKILRPEKVIPAIQQLVIKELGEKFVEIPPFDLETTYLDSSCKSPLIFILSSGADPRGELENLALKMGMRSDLITMSLGQGQGDIAEGRIRDGWVSGKWILLQNCHLMPSWMAKLEFLFESTPSDCHPNFRLWLTTVPSPVFPVSVLQNGLKITYEPPKGLKNNLHRCYLQVDNKQFENSSKPDEWKKLLFGLIFFHALVLERRKFGPLGWNIPYEFAATDLEISISQLFMFLEEYDEIPWTALNYMVAEANYGGRVTDDRDRRLISTVLKDFYSVNILKDSYKFSPSGVYYAPENGAIDSYYEYIKGLPLNDLPEAFGMHPNAEVSGAIYDTNNLSQTIISILPKEAAGGGTSQEQVVIDKCKASLDKLPKLFDVEQCCRKRPVLFEESMNTVLQQEILRFNRLLSVVRNSLSNVIKAIDGTVTMNNDLVDVFNSVVTNQIPSLWARFSYPSLKPLASYLIDFIDRLAFIQKWIDEGAPSAFWISGFFFTQSFLTGTKQNYARKYKIPIDSLIFDFNIIDEDNKDIDLTQKPEDGIYIYGLYLDGARWDTDIQAVNEQLPNQLYCYMPHIHLIPIVNTLFKETHEKYHCPVYRTSVRKGTLSTTGHSTNFVLYIHLPLIENTHNSAHWIKRGVALLTQLDD